MANYIIARNGELKQCDNNALAHANGWKKKGAKYIKRIPKPGGGFTYIYKESGLDARSNLGKAQANFKKSLITNRGMSGVAANRVAGTNTQIAKNKYDKTPAGKVENAAKSATSKAKTTIKKAKSAIDTGLSKAKETKAQYDKQQKKKKLDKALTELSPAYRISKDAIEKTKETADNIGDKINKAKKKIDKKINKVKKALSNPVDTLDKAAKKKKLKRVKTNVQDTIDRTINDTKALGAMGVTKLTGKEIEFDAKLRSVNAKKKFKTKKKKNGKVEIRSKY